MRHIKTRKNKLGIQEIQEAEELRILPDHEDAMAVLMEDVFDFDESPLEIYCFTSGHFFYPDRGSSLEQRAFDHMACGYDLPLAVSSRECLICMRQASKVNDNPTATETSPREEMLDAVAENPNVNWQ